MKTNHAKERMLAGRPALGAAVGLGSPVAAELYSQQGWDFVLIDGQHGNWSLDTTTAAIRSVLAGTAAPMVRVQKNDFFAIGSLLDRGALGVVVPMVHTRQEAEAAAFAARFPPIGGRSQGGFGTAILGVAEYERWANEQVFLAIQIESERAVEHAEDLLSTPGVDGCWIGPADLAASLGVDLGTDSGRRRHEEAIMHVLEACRRTAKAPGIAGGTRGERWLEKGFLFVTCAGDIPALRDTGTQTLAALQRYR